MTVKINKHILSNNSDNSSIAKTLPQIVCFWLIIKYQTGRKIRKNTRAEKKDRKKWLMSALWKGSLTNNNQSKIGLLGLKFFLWWTWIRTIRRSWKNSCFISIDELLDKKYRHKLCIITFRYISVNLMNL